VTSAVLVRLPAPTTVTVPVPDGVVQAPSPRRNVVLEQVPEAGTNAEKKFAPDGVASHVPTPVPSPVSWLAAIDLLVSVCVAVRVTTVSLPLGKVQVLEEGIANVGLNAPVKDTFPAKVIVWPVFATPVPPLAPGSKPLTSAVNDTAELVHVCVDPAKWQRPIPGEAALTTLAATTPESVTTQVVLVVVQSSRCPVVGTAVGPVIVLEAVIPVADASVKVNAFEAFRSPTLPVVVLATPRTGVDVRLGTPLELVFGTEPLAVASHP